MIPNRSAATEPVQDRPAVTLLGVVTPKSIKKEFEETRKVLVNKLVRDPLDHLAYWVNLERNASYLAHRIKNESYRPGEITIIRGSKGNGITRPLAHLELEDHLAYASMVRGIESRLTGNFPDWVGCSRRQLKSPTDEQLEPDYLTWFDQWLRSQKLIERMALSVGPWPFLVVADVANYFPSIQMAHLRSAIAAQVRVEDRFVNLLFLLLDRIAPRAGYAGHGEPGLPQEDFDVSRLMAHFLLGVVDEQFSDLGKAGGYVRWMDDFRIGAKSVADGQAILGRLAEYLERIGLSLNAKKCRVVESKEIQESLWPEENAKLERLQKGPWVDEEVRTAISEFLAKDRTEGWERVLRRYYTLSRKSQCHYLLEHWEEHLRLYPGAIHQILGFLRTMPHELSLLQKVQSYLRSDANLYEDIEILLYDRLLLRWRHNPRDSQALALVDGALDHFHGRNGWPHIRSDYVASLISLVIFRSGTGPQCELLSKGGLESSNRHFQRQLLVIDAATSSDQFNLRATAFEDREFRRLAAFLQALLNQPIGKDVLEKISHWCAPRLAEGAWCMEPRALPLIRVTAKKMLAKDRETWIRSMLGKLLLTGDHRRDFSAVAFLQRELAP